MQYAARSHVGLIRDVNEDGFLVRQLNESEYTVIVADGMGGHVAGEVASALAVETVWDVLQQHSELEPMRRLESAVQVANDRIYEQAATCETYSGMGTTVVSAIAGLEHIWIAHVGDSRMYLFRPTEGLLQLTQDHSYVNELVRRGQITANEVMHHPQRHLLMRTLGTLPSVVVECSDLNWHEQDRLFACSDGLTGTVTEDEMIAILASDDTLDQQVGALIDVALARGGPDNITVVALLHDGTTEWRGQV